MTTAFTATGMPSTTTSGGGHGLSDGAWNWLGRNHCCGRRELASRLQRSRQLRKLQQLLVFEDKGADDALRFLYISFCGNVHLLNIVAGLGYKMDQHSNNIMKTVICF